LYPHEVCEQDAQSKDNQERNETRWFPHMGIFPMEAGGFEFSEQLFNAPSFLIFRKDLRG